MHHLPARSDDLVRVVLLLDALPTAQMDALTPRDLPSIQWLRERRANIINADGEKAAAETLAQAAEILAKTQGAINLRTLNTLERISTEPSQKTMMLFPIELIDAIRGGKK